MRPETLPVAVIMERLRLDNPWCSAKWQAIGVVEDGAPPGTPPRVIFEDEKCRRVLHTGFTLELYRDEAENYWLNVSATEPRVFVLWRYDDQGEACPAFVTVSYGEAARWMDADEQVDGVPMPPEIYRWVGEYVEAHYRPDPEARKQRRYASSRLEHHAKFRPG
ncbi:DUF3305 domain-containing protein [Pelomicrobium methylotrophicum]|uniref:DUF3305 domain-containing protein n=1 Tax=Pelomicrobium methylotrophicum TaxID=2602750 RepID=A0A5C7EMP0_9PROT|nr:DUF3305 domain-containing protein [Pelomicrobium methylotrophicum]TXF12461.1 DUF3305 domain-containing protein [Pelomicrobium methylotrophicum]